ncbi:hypothetical protein ONZ51_g8908 [Trametes cubensis]|uniref:Uncharacterized protein n=1 Tax=Trametes cubensis TaxID=1111947 RepID=A0AAD7TPU4_9APHY|nr:hypothetical protein ONZ51_g8908 [Trametes cubensis]
MNTAASETSVTTLPSVDDGAFGETHHPAHGSLREHDSVGSLFTRSSGEEETAGVVKSTDLSGAVEETSANADEVRSTTPSEDGDIYSSDSDDGFIPRGYTTGASASKRKTTTVPSKPSGTPTTAQSSKATSTTPVASKVPSLPAKKTTAPAKRS